jgi:hypothetical protein
MDNYNLNQLARFRGDGFRRMTQQNSQRQNRQHRKNEVQRVRLVIKFLCRQRNRDKNQQPEQRVAADLLKEQLHANACSVWRNARRY